ncbi:BglG family transcription antiterminator [Bacillus litorisediminis]|uniref:BglG family transcription antiterminator n=1 Tax=Bacillus litorisediminis TaxID=2922713 RepID=UPI001FAB3ADF|nr:BglG family transcription antiterminator [Bacillus litorisediminis]
MFLDDRSVNLLQELIKNPQIKNKELEHKFQLSRRQITYSIEKINDWLKSNQLDPITKSKNGYFIIDKKVFDYFSEGDSDDVEEYLPTEKERALLIILYLLGKKEAISLFHIIDLLNVSRNTGISDIKEAEELVKQYSLSIIYTRQDGYNIVGDELQIRRLLIEVVKSVLNFYKGYRYFEKFLQLDISETTEKIKHIEKYLNIHLTDESYESLPYIIELIFQRIEQGNLLNAHFNIYLDELADTEEYAASEMLLKEGQDLPVTERIWLTLQLLTSNVRSADLLTDEIIQDLKSAIKEMINCFEQKSCIFIADKEEILEKLMLHMRPAYYRIKYHLTLKNHFPEKIIEEYRELNEIVAASIYPLENLIGEKLPPSEIAFITMFIAGQLIKQGEQLNRKKRAIVVCSNGLSISKIMIHTLNEIFPEFYFADSLSLRQFQSYQQEYDIVFSTIPVQTKKPVFLVNPLMTISEKDGLRRQVINKIDKKSFTNININRLVETIKEHAIITDEVALLTSLSKLFQVVQRKDNKDIAKNVPYGLKQFLPYEFIQLKESVDTWEEAIILACQPLLERNIIKPSYVNTLIEENDRQHLYSFLGKNMAIPHASPEKGVLADAFAMLILKKPISFKNGHKVSIITPLAIYNQNRHLKALSQLVELAEDEERISKIIDSKDVSEAWLIINEAS